MVLDPVATRSIFGIFLFSSGAKMSTSGLPNLFMIWSKAYRSSYHSISSFINLDSLFASVFSLEGISSRGTKKSQKRV